MTMVSRNPATGEELERYDTMEDDALESALADAWSAFVDYRLTSFEERAAWLEEVARILEEEKEEWGRLMTREMGKPIGQGEAEAEKCAWVCRYFAEHGAAFLQDERIETEADASWVAFQPVGPVLAIMPWNFPFWQVFRFAAPALMAGNVGLLKHAPNVPGCALAIERIFRRAGFPEGVFQALLIEVPAVERVLDDPRVRAATLTGSERAGGAVAARAGARIKRTVLELGGSDPFIVMPSADLDRAVATAVRARSQNAGQSCIAAKRFILAEPIADAFQARFVEAMASLVVGDPMDPATELGPMAREDLRDGLHAQVTATVEAGARVLTGGEPVDGPGWFYRPTVLCDIPEGSPAYDEELFGPVASLFRVPGIGDAIALANGTAFGLGASVWTADAAERDRFIRDIEAGCVFVNDMVASDPRMPFGGVKRSGYGRELSRYGMLEFVNIKGVSVRDAGG